MYVVDDNSVANGMFVKQVTVTSFFFFLQRYHSIVIGDKRRNPFEWNLSALVETPRGHL